MPHEFGYPTIGEIMQAERNKAANNAGLSWAPQQPAPNIDAAREALRILETQQQAAIDAANQPQRDILAARQRLQEAEQRAQQQASARGEYGQLNAAVQNANTALYNEMAKAARELLTRFKPLADEARQAALTAESHRRRADPGLMPPVPAELQITSLIAAAPKEQQAALFALYSIVFNGEPTYNLTQFSPDRQYQILQGYYNQLG